MININKIKSFRINTKYSQYAKWSPYCRTFFNLKTIEIFAFTSGTKQNVSLQLQNLLSWYGQHDRTSKEKLYLFFHLPI